MNRLLVGTLVLSVMGAPLAFAQPDAGAQAPPAPQAPQSTNQVGPYNQDRAGQPGIPNAQGQTPPAARGPANAPYPYGGQPYGGQAAQDQGYQANAAGSGATADRERGYSTSSWRRVPRRGSYSYRRHRLRVCKWRGHHRVCFWR